MATPRELEDIEVKRYLKMISQKGYGHTIEDVEKRVRAGVAIAHEIHRNIIAAYTQLKEDNKALREALEYLQQGENCDMNEAAKSKIKTALKNLTPCAK